MHGLHMLHCVQTDDAHSCLLIYQNLRAGKGRMTGGWPLLRRRPAGAGMTRVVCAIGLQVAPITSAAVASLSKQAPRPPSFPHAPRKHALRNHGSHLRVPALGNVGIGAATAWIDGPGRRRPPCHWPPLGAAGAGEAGAARCGQGQAGTGDSDRRGVRALQG